MFFCVKIVLDVVYVIVLLFFFIFIGGRLCKKYEKSVEILNDRDNIISFIEIIIILCYNVCIIINFCLNVDCCCVCIF